MASKHEVRPGVWRVRWREGSRHRSRTLGNVSEKEAEAVRQEIERAERLGTLSVLLAPAKTLSEVAEEWWDRYEARGHAASTLAQKAGHLRRHIFPELGCLNVRDIDVDRVERWISDRLRAGAGTRSMEQATDLLGQILRLAARQGLIAQNPVPLVERPKSSRRKLVRPLAPESVEAIRAHMELRDATLVSLLAYAGLRPHEALALRWADVSDRGILVDPQKTEKGRRVRLLAPLAQDLRAFRLASGRPADTELVLPNRDFQGRPTGKPWTKTTWDTWRRDRWAPALERAGIEYQRPYGLRHAFASLLIAEGYTVVEVASQLGHTVGVCMTTYLHLFDEFEAGSRISAEDRIRRAREDVARRAG